MPDFSHAISDNISVGGLSFIDESFFPTETLLMFEINLLSRVLHPAGRVAWSQALPHCARRRTGIEFVELNQSEKNYLTDYISMQLNHGRGI